MAVTHTTIVHLALIVAGSKRQMAGIKKGSRRGWSAEEHHVVGGGGGGVELGRE